jgi:hypothetical protein
MICTMSKHAAEAKGYSDALMLDYRGNVAEATGANIMFVKEGTLYTPTPDCFLNGITRRSVEGLARIRQIPVVERHIRPKRWRTFGMLPRRHGGGSDAGVRDRPLPVYAGRHQPRALERLRGRRAARSLAGNIVSYFSHRAAAASSLALAATQREASVRRSSFQKGALVLR